MSTWWAGLAFWLAAGLLVSVTLTCLASLLLIGLPHGWDTATSWADVRLRLSWIALFVLPAAATVHLVLWLCTRDRGRDRGRGPGAGGPGPVAGAGPRPGSSRRGGLHR
ncbi:hypothetical protein ACWCQ7_09725 [Streptomyces spinosirectus]